jgi:ABC-type uncharacterized transport system permease subunit
VSSLALRRIGRGVLSAALLLVILIAVLAAFGLPLAESIRHIIGGAAGDKFGIARTLVKTTPLLLTGLGIAVAWRAGMYNIGGEGQFVLGGLTGALAAKLLGSAPPLIATVTILLGSILGGAAWAGLSGWLFVKRGVEVVISTILLNFVALQLLSWAVSGPLKEARGRLPLTDLLPQSVMLFRPDRKTDLHIGILMALAAAVLTYIFLYRTTWGFRLRLVGANASAARANRINAKHSQLLAMAVSGALCGLAGGVEYSGMSGQLGTGFAVGWGFLGIPVALLGNLHPLILPFSALFFGGLFAGTENLARFTQAGTTLLYVVQGAAVLAFVGLRAASSRRPVEGA